MEIALGIPLGKFAFADVVRLVVELGFDVSNVIEDAVPETRSVNVGEIELLSPEFEPTSVAMLPEGEVAGTMNTSTFDVRKQTLSHLFSITSILSF